MQNCFNNLIFEKCNYMNDRIVIFIYSNILFQVATHPEMLAAILSVEALEDNEVLIIEGVRHMARINDPRHKAIFEGISKPNVVSEMRNSLDLCTI